MVSDRVAKMPPNPIGAALALVAKTPNCISLAHAKPKAGTPDHINKAAIQAIEKGLCSAYSPVPGLPELKQAICKKLKRDNNISALPSEVLVTVGAIEALSCAATVCLDPGDEILFPSPSYSGHDSIVRIASAKTVWVPTVEEDCFRLDIDAFRKAVTGKTKAIMYCNPSNPTGAVFPEKDLRELCNFALEHDLNVITDEAYEYFLFDNEKHFCIGSIPEMKDHAISVFTFTKTYAMTGWRIGYAVASEAMMPQMMKPHIPFTICAPVVSQYAALEAISGPQDCVEQFKQKYLNFRDITCSRLDALSHVFEYQKPKGSYCIFPKILGNKDSAKFCKELTTEVGVGTVPGIGFGPTGESHLRMTFCTSAEEINQAFDRMDKHFKK